MKGEQNVPLDRQEVWRALNDREVLAACVPGCESLEQTSDNEFKAKVRAAVGPVKSQFKGRVTLSDVKPSESYKLSFKGDGNAGFIKGHADVWLAPAESGQGTAISYTAQATVGGKLAQVGSRLVDGAARQMADDFFSNLTTHLGGTPQAARAAEETAPAPSAAEAQPVWTRLISAVRGLLAKLFGRGGSS